MPLAEERCKQSSFYLPVEAAVSVFSFTCAVTAKGKGNGVRWIFVTGDDRWFWHSQEREQRKIWELIWQQQAMQRGLGKASHRCQSSDDFFSRIAIEPVMTHGLHFGEEAAQSHMVCRGEPAEPRQ
jgi:hypothetical protein